MCQDIIHCIVIQEVQYTHQLLQCQNEDERKFSGSLCKAKTHFWLSRFTITIVSCESVSLRVFPGADLQQVRHVGPIRDQYSGHVTCLDQSEDSIEVT